MTIEEFQDELKGKNNKYKRYLGSPLRYPGGKSLAVGMITEYLPKDVKKVVSPFIGGGSVEVALAKELGLEVVGYDIFDLLANFWQQVTVNGEEIYKKLSELKPTKEEFARVKGILSEHWTKENGYDGKLGPIDAAAYYYFNMQLSYGPAFLGWMSSIYESEKRYNSTLEKIKNFYVPNLKVYCKRFEESIPENQGEFLYLDPPYVIHECADSKTHKGMYPAGHIPIHHKGFDHAKLAELLHEHKGGFLLSYNDCSLVREAYKDFEIHEVKWQYTMGQGETRIGKVRSGRDYDKDNIKTSHEVLIVGK